MVDKFIGSEAFTKGLRGLPEVLTEKVLAVADRKLAASLRGEVRKTAPQSQKRTPQNTRYGTLRKNIRGRGTRRGTRLRRENITQIVGTGDAFWALFLEFGTENRTTASGANRGKITATSFFEKAIDSVEARGLDIYQNAAVAEFDKQIAALQKPFGSLSAREKRVLRR